MRASIVTALSLLVVVPRIVDGEVCVMKTTDSLLVEAKNRFLAKLGLSEDPGNPTNISYVPENFVDNVVAADLVQNLKPRSSPCALTDFLDRDVTRFPLVQSSEMVHTGKKMAQGTSCSIDTSVDFVTSYKLKFNPVIKSGNVLVHAELQLRKLLLHLLNHTRPRSQVDRVDVSLIVPPSKGLRYGHVEYVTTEFLNINSIVGRAVFNVTKAIKRWQEISWNSSAYAGEIELEVSFRCPQDALLYVPNFQFQVEKSFLSITTVKDRHKHSVQRSRRQNTNDDGLQFCDAKKDGCCLKKFTVDFERDLNMTWVIAPKKIEFNYCSGLCPLTGQSGLHAEFLDLLRSVTKNPTAAGSPCCVPNSYRSRSINIIAGGFFSTVVLPDIEATSCACR